MPVVMPEWDTLRKRIEYILESRQKSLRQLCLDAGLAESTIGNALRREDSGKRVSFEGDTLAKVAKAASVDVGWLNTGEGKPEPDYVAPSPVPDVLELIRRVANRLVKYEHITLERALVLLHESRPAEQTFDGYYFAVRDRLIAELEQGDKRKVGGRPSSSVIGAQKR